MRPSGKFGELRRRAASILDRRFDEVNRRLGALAVENQVISAALRDVGRELVAARERAAEERDQLRALSNQLRALQDQLTPVLRAIVSEETANRRRLGRLRADPEYTTPFDHPDPLVTVCIPTHDRVELLTERALPSVLAQTHQRLDVLVVGDGSPPHLVAAVEAIADERVRFVNLTHRHAVTDAEHHWLVGSAPARNAAYTLAAGHWIVDFDDDDSMRPEAVERVLAMAREQRLEVVYGKHAVHFADGRTQIGGRFPPTVHQFGWQGAAVHAGLGFIGRDPVAAAFGHPNDWFRIETMMRIGVRMGMVYDVLYDYYPARSWERPTPVPESAYVEEHAW